MPLHSLKATVKSFTPKVEEGGKVNEKNVFDQENFQPKSLSRSEDAFSAIFSPKGGEQDFDFAISQLKRRLDSNRHKYGKKVKCFK